MGDDEENEEQRWERERKERQEQRQREQEEARERELQELQRLEREMVMIIMHQSSSKTPLSNLLYEMNIDSICTQTAFTR